MRSRVRERRTHGSVRGLRREPLVYSTTGKMQEAKNRDLRKVLSQRYSPVYLYLCSLVANFPNQELSDKDKELIRQYTTNRYFKG